MRHRNEVFKVQGRRTKKTKGYRITGLSHNEIGDYKTFLARFSDSFGVSGRGSSSTKDQERFGGRCRLTHSVYLGT